VCCWLKASGSTAQPSAVALALVQVRAAFVPWVLLLWEGLPVHLRYISGTAAVQDAGAVSDRLLA
jgi:hypothetical protein